MVSAKLFSLLALAASAQAQVSTKLSSKGYADPSGLEKCQSTAYRQRQNKRVYRSSQEGQQPEGDPRLQLRRLREQLQLFCLALLEQSLGVRVPGLHGRIPQELPDREDACPVLPGARQRRRCLLLQPRQGL